MKYSKKERIDFLVSFKFPDDGQVRLAVVIGQATDAQRLEFAKAKQYRAELEAMSDAEIESMYLPAQRAADAHRESMLFFNMPDAVADLVHWSKAAEISPLDEGTPLLFRKEPTVVTWERVQPLVRSERFAREYARARDLVGRAVKAGDLTDPARPSKFFAWARGRGFDVAPELLPGGPAQFRNIDYVTPHLAVVDAAIAEFFFPRRNVGPKRDEVVDWISRCLQRAGLGASRNIAEAIFTIIKPTDHNPKKPRRAK